VAWLERNAASSKSEPQVGQGPSSSSLDGWRLIARTGTEALFARGVPLRVTRDGVRASSWRLDPTHELRADDTVLRILVTEQTYAGGKRADGRVLDPDLYEDEDELILSMFVSPLEGFQMRRPNPETPVRIALPKPVGRPELIDGAIYERWL
jgi:hypothetical protein